MDPPIRHRRTRHPSVDLRARELVDKTPFKKRARKRQKKKLKTKYVNVRKHNGTETPDLRREK